MRAPARWRLGALHAVARAREAGARAALADGLGEVDRRCGEEDAAREALRAHREFTERAAHAAPPGAVGSLAGAARYASRRAAEEGALAEALAAAVSSHGEARAEVERRRAALAAARAAAGRLEAGRAEWRRARARDRERIEEEAVDEAVSARRGGAW